MPSAATGRLTAVFEDLPQLPYANLKIHFREGQRAPLVTPSACGSFATAVDLTPWSNAAAGAHSAPEFSIAKGIGAGDIVLVDKKGRRFHALVTELEQLESGRYELIVRPLDSRISYRTATVREVLEVWRKRRA